MSDSRYTGSRHDEALANYQAKVYPESAMDEQPLPTARQESDPTNGGNKNSRLGSHEPEIARLASAQSFLILAVLNQLLAAGMSGVINALDGASLVRIELLIGLQVLMFFAACAAVFMIVNALDGTTGVPLIWCLGVIVPIVSLIVLLILNQRATSRLKSSGLKIGLLGAKGLHVGLSRHVGVYFLIWAVFIVAAQVDRYIRPNDGTIQGTAPFSMRP